MDTRKVKKAYLLNQWTEIVRKCRSSGQTVAIFCNEQNLNPKIYYYWLRLVREAACEALPAIANEKNRIVPLTLGESTACPSKSAVNTKITLYYGEFSLDLDENTIRTLMNLQGKSSC